MVQRFGRESNRFQLPAIIRFNRTPTHSYLSSFLNHSIRPDHDIKREEKKRIVPFVSIRQSPRAAGPSTNDPGSARSGSRRRLASWPACGGSATPTLICCCSKRPRGHARTHADPCPADAVTQPPEMAARAPAEIRVRSGLRPAGAGAGRDAGFPA